MFERPNLDKHEFYSRLAYHTLYEKPKCDNYNYKEIIKQIQKETELKNEIKELKIENKELFEN